MNLTVRPATTEDAQAIARLSQSALGYCCTAELVKEGLRQLNSNREAVFVAEEAGIVQGFVHVETYRVLYFSPMANLLGLAVLEQARRKGIGRKLMEAAERWAKDRGLTTMRLNSGASRTEAHTFYRSLGYSGEKGQLRFLKEL